MNCGPNCGSGNREPRSTHTSLVHTTCVAQRASPGSRVWRHPNPWSTHKPCSPKDGPGCPEKGSTQTRACTQASWPRGRARGAERGAHGPVKKWAGQEDATRAHTPRDTEGGPQELRRGGTSPTRQRVSSGGLREAHTSLHDAEGTVGETRKDPHRSLPSKLRPAAKGS